MTARRGTFEVEVRLTQDPAGRPAVLLQLPDGYITMSKPAGIRSLAKALEEAADELDAVLEDVT